jgi:hypothetical protein
MPQKNPANSRQKVNQLHSLIIEQKGRKGERNRGREKRKEGRKKRMKVYEK